MSDSGTELGRKFRELREAKGLSLQDVSDATGISKSYIGQIETRGIEVSFVKTCKLAELYSADLNDLAAQVNSSPTKRVTLSDPPDILKLEDCPRVIEVGEDDNGSRCGCSCGCTERYYAIASSFCRWCRDGACDCSPSAIARDGVPV